MSRFLLNRLLTAFLVVFAAATLLFAILRLAPGDPAVLMVGPTATPDQIADAREWLGLDEPIFVQYADYVWSLLHLEFGYSFRLNSNAIDLVMQRLPNTILLALSATALAILVGIPAGVTAGRNPGSVSDRALSIATLAGQSLPTFWVGIMFILFFARHWHLLPSGGSGTFWHLILPSIALAMPFAAVIARLTRSGTAEVVTEPFVLAVRAKGLAEWRVLYLHVVRNCLIPVVTVVGLQIGALIGGAVVVESVFSWPGVGRLLVDAITNRDYSIVQAATIVIAIIVVTLNIATDFIYALLDPRIRTQS